MYNDIKSNKDTWVNTEKCNKSTPESSVVWGNYSLVVLKYLSSNSSTIDDSSNYPSTREVSSVSTFWVLPYEYLHWRPHYQNPYSIDSIRHTYKVVVSKTVYPKFESSNSAFSWCIIDYVCYKQYYDTIKEIGERFSFSQIHLFFYS